MSKTIIEKIQDKIDKLEKEKMDYLEVGKITTVNKKEEEIEHYNLDYNTELLMYRDLIVCETITISKLEEIEVF